MWCIIGFLHVSAAADKRHHIFTENLKSSTVSKGEKEKKLSSLLNVTTCFCGEVTHSLALPESLWGSACWHKSPQGYYTYIWVKQHTTVKTHGSSPQSVSVSVGNRQVSRPTVTCGIKDIRCVHEGSITLSGHVCRAARGHNPQPLNLTDEYSYITLALNMIHFSFSFMGTWWNVDLYLC